MSFNLGLCCYKNEMNRAKYRKVCKLYIVLCLVVAFFYVRQVSISLLRTRHNIAIKVRYPVVRFFKAPILKYKKLIKGIRKKKRKNVSYATNLTMINTKYELEEYKKGFKQHSFNILASDRIGFQSRLIPDSRPQDCRAQKYKLQAEVSIVICFYNEAVSTLLRTISTVFNRTSPALLKEIIVVDDASNYDVEYSKIVNSFVKIHFPNKKLHFLSSTTRMGLIGARMFGARHATGDTLVFLDSHCEVNIGWIEPLLHELTNDSRKVVSPIIDIISPDTFDYEPSLAVRGGFNWGLHFEWEALPKNLTDPLKAFPTPAVSGGVLAVKRDSFFDLGGYDEGMMEWGGENLELSFRTWMCGGSLAIAPCSRVGHVFRNRRPYGGNSSSALRNVVRIVKVWLDDYRIHFLNARSGYEINVGDLAERYRLRHHKLHCKTFKWYLYNVYPELGIPDERSSQVKYHIARKKPGIVGRGHIKSLLGLHICLMCREVDVLQATICQKKDSTQKFTYTSTGEIRVGKKNCLTASLHNPKIYRCDSTNSFQKWRFLGEEKWAVSGCGRVPLPNQAETVFYENKAKKINRFARNQTSISGSLIFGLLKTSDNNKEIKRMSFDWLQEI